MIRAGDLKYTVVIQAPVETPNEYGEPEKTWTDFATRRASMTALTGREYFQAQETHAEVTTRFRLRPLADITPRMRVVCNGRYFDIKSVIDLAASRELILMTVERQ